jgi:aspartate/methionine/tyrosine aminotransferase
LGAQVLKIQDCLQICPARAGQAAVTWALEALDEWRERNRRRFGKQATQFRSALADVRDWKIDSLGAFFAYLRHPFRDVTAEQVAQRLASQNGLLMIPGSYFGPGQDDHLRVSFGNLTAESFDQLPERLRL